MTPTDTTASIAEASQLLAEAASATLAELRHAPPTRRNRTLRAQLTELTAAAAAMARTELAAAAIWDAGFTAGQHAASRQTTAHPRP